MGHLLDDEAGLSEEEKKRIEKLRVQFEATLKALKWSPRPLERPETGYLGVVRLLRLTRSFCSSSLRRH